MNTLTFSLNESATLSALLWEPSPALQDESRPRPGILICPGGGYNSHAHREADPIAVRFAAMGYHAFVLRYTLPQEAGECLYPKPLIDIGTAIQCIRDHAKAWCLDENRIALCGFSAGGQLALLYSVQCGRGMLAGYPKPALCIAGYPVVDMLGWRNDQCRDPETLAVRDECRRGLFGTIHPDESLLLKADPTNDVPNDAPPMFLWATCEDKKVPPCNTLKMAQALTQAGVPMECHLFESGPHGLALADQASAGTWQKMNREASRWSELCFAWLQKRFALTLMP